MALKARRPGASWKRRPDEYRLKPWPLPNIHAWPVVIGAKRVQVARKAKRPGPRQQQDLTDSKRPSRPLLLPSGSQQLRHFDRYTSPLRVYPVEASIVGT